MTYTVRPGDTLSKIAMRNGVTVAQLMQANPQIKDPNKIKVGDVINVPRRHTQQRTLNRFQPLRFLHPHRAPAPAIGALGKAIADELGTLSAKYETGGRGPGTVSTGVRRSGRCFLRFLSNGDEDGCAGAFCLLSRDFHGRQDFQNLAPGTAQFTAVWKRIAGSPNRCFPGSPACLHQERRTTICWSQKY